MVNNVITFAISVLLARLLEPDDFGLIGISLIFLSFSRVFIDGGFSDSLIRKQDCTQTDYDSIFYFNLSTSFFFYVILFLLSEPIADFYKRGELVNIIRISSLGLIIGSLGAVQISILRKNIDFKKQAVLSSVGSLLNGTLALSMAFTGYKFWSLIVPGVVASSVRMMLLWRFIGWRPKRNFDISVLRKHFEFGSKIMLGSFLLSLYQNIYAGFIGKIFSISEVGFYNRADNLQKLPSQNLDTVIRHVSYPLLSSIQDEVQKLKSTYRLILKNTAFLNTLIVLHISVLAENIVIVLYGNKWVQVVPYLQLLPLIGFFLPLISINVNIYNVKGRSDLSLLSTILQLTLSIPALTVCYFWGIIPMLYAMLCFSLLHYLFLTNLTEKVIDYKMKEQLLDLRSPVLFALLPATMVYAFNKISGFTPGLELFLSLVLSVFLIILFGRILNNSEYKNFEQIIINQVKSKTNK